MTNRDYAAFKVAVTMTVVVAVISADRRHQLFVQRVLEINWRRSMTNDLVSRWMRGHVPYRDRARPLGGQR